VRLFGSGRWTRDAEGKWSLDFLAVDSFDPLREETLSQAIARIASIDVGWDHESIGELISLRNDPEQDDGGI
jgi:hypothetical protein